MKINWFSPLPPAETGIALYTARLVPALRQRVDLTLWTDQRTWDDRLIDVRRFDAENPPWNELNHADINIYNIGNNILHRGIWELSRRHSGVVILHDSCLQHFFGDLYLNRLKDVDAYRQAMFKYYGEKGLAAINEYLAHALSIDELAVSFPLTGLALDNAFCGITHSGDLQASALRLPVPTYGLNLPYSSNALQRMSTTMRHKRTAPPYQLIAFGIMGSNRRLEPFLEAWGSVPEKSAFRLLVAGRVWNRDYLQRRIRELGLEDLIHICGYLTDDELHSELARSDLGINLRYPTMGEASLSQLLMWEHSIPTLVTKVGWYANLPSDAVAFVRPEQERSDIRQQLTRFLQDPAQFAEMGRRGREILEREHSPERYVDSLLHLLRDAARWGGSAGGQMMAVRARDMINPWMPAAAGQLLKRRTVEAIESMCGLSSALPGFQCLERERLMHHYVLKLSSYRREVMGAGAGQGSGVAIDLMQLREACQSARSEVMQHIDTHHC